MQAVESTSAESVLSGSRQRRIRIWLIVLGLMALAGWAGVLGFAYLVTDWPLVLIALSPLNRHLVIVAASVEPWAFVSVGLARCLLSCLAGHQLGSAVGPEALVWLEENSPRLSRWVRWVERLFQRSAYAALLLWPGLVVSMLGGIAEMRVGAVMAVASVGLLARLLVILYLGQWLLEPIEWLLAQIGQYRLEITLTIVVGFGVYQWIRRARSGAAGPDGAGDVS